MRSCSPSCNARAQRVRRELNEETALKLGDFCPAPCFETAPDFLIPGPGCRRDQLRFASQHNRDFYAVLLNNHPPQDRSKLNPRVAIVGLSPGRTQIEEFVSSYAKTGDYGAASVAGAFADLSSSIIAMLCGLGLADKLNLAFPRGTLALHPDVYVTSLIACASLELSGSSDAFDPVPYAMAARCIGNRFVSEMLDRRFTRLQVILILGTHAWDAIQNIKHGTGETVLQTLRASGKLVLQLPHPSGQNKEYIGLASLEAHEFPTLDQYVARRWEEYRVKPPRRGRAKQPEALYKRKRTTAWQTVQRLRQEIDALDPLP